MKKFVYCISQKHRFVPFFPDFPYENLIAISYGDFEAKKMGFDVAYIMDREMTEKEIEGNAFVFIRETE